jgi:PucR C-terminal helix-turn-helix domain/GGDEF-like domain
MSGVGRVTTRSLEGIDSSGNRPGLDHLRRTQDALLERLAAAIERDYDEVHQSIACLPGQRRTDIVQTLLAGESVECAELAALDYELHARWHVGIIATGTGFADALRRVKPELGCELLLVTGGDTVWAWIGASYKLDGAEVERLLSVDAGAWSSLAMGVVRSGLDGWRRTHQEAKAALPQALQTPQKIVRYGDRPLLTVALENEALGMWLRDFLVPLRSRADGGMRLLETLRAYLDTECNCSSAASLLNVRRQTVTSRLRIVEELLGRQIGSCLGELDTALRLVDIAARDSPASHPGLV